MNGVNSENTERKIREMGNAHVNPVLVKENMRKHNPDSPFLIGGYMPGDIVREAKQESWVDRQIRLEF